jgi:hypothetical protein
MAGGGIEIPFTSNTRDLLRGTKDVQGGLEDVQDSLDDLVKAADKDALSTSMGKEAREVERETERIEKSFEELSDTQKRETKGLGDGIGENVKRGTDKAGEGLDEFKDEANSTARESAASFDGSAESIIDSFQEVAANAFAGFGPAGAVAGLAIAAGIGIAVAAGTSLAEAQAEAKQRTHELALELYDLGGDVDRLDIGAKVREWFGEDSISTMKAFWESSDTNFETATRYSKRLGLGIDDVVRSLSGFDGEATDEMRALGEEMLRTGDLTEGQSNLLREYIGDLSSTADQLGLTAEEAEVMERVTRAQSEATEAAAAAEERRTDVIGSLQSGIDEAIGSFDEYMGKEGDAADPTAYVNGIRERIAATGEFNGNVQRLASEFGLSQEGIQAVVDQGIDFAPMLQSILDSGLAPEYVAQITAGLNAGQNIIDGTPLSSTVDVDADTSQAERDVKSVEAKPRKTDVDVKAQTKAASRDIDAVAKAKRTATIDVRADTGSARRAIDRLGDERTATIRAVASTGGADRALDNLASQYRTATIHARVVDRNGKQVS